MIEGSDPILKQQYVTIASHLDGAVGTREVDGDRIYNSADDNATGSAGTLAIAEQLMKGPRPKRSVIFIWDSGEERGLWGTRRFVHQPPVPLDRVVAHVNVDMIGATRAPGTADAGSPDVTGPNEVFLMGPGVLSPTVDALLERVNASYLRMTLNRRDDRPESAYLLSAYRCRAVPRARHPHHRLHDRIASALPPARRRGTIPGPGKDGSRHADRVRQRLGAPDTPDRPRIERPIPATVPRYAANQ